MMAVGGLVALLCGACTLIFGGAGLIGLVMQLLHNQSAASMSIGPASAVYLTVIAAVVGGVPTAVGALLFFAGLRRWRGAR